MGGVSGGMKALIGGRSNGWIIAKCLYGVWVVLVLLLGNAVLKRVNASTELAAALRLTTKG